jgi:PAS domain S-box-containing protein
MNAKEQKTLLLVDDEVIIAMSEKMALEKYGYKVITAYTGKEAVKAIDTTPGIDLILMDINLGAGMDGTEAAAIILEDHDLPIVFLSSHTEPEVVEKTEKITSYGYVVKNSSSTVLDASIKMAFKLFAAKTSEKEKESALRESETRYRVLFSGATDGILVADAQTKKFRYANPAICRMLGYTEEEFFQISVKDIHPAGSLDRVLAEFDSLVRGEMRSSSDLPCLRKDGSIFYANISHGTMVIEGHMHDAGFFHDVTERKRANDIMQESQLRLKAQYQGMPIPTFTWQKQGEDFELIDFNAAAMTITHDKVIEFIGRKAGNLYSNRKDILQDLQECFAEGKVIKRETLSEHFVTGKLIALTFVPIPPDLVMVHMEDITERRQVNKALQKSEERMRAIVEGTPHLFFYSQNAEANNTYVSPTVEQVTGHKVDVWLKRKDWFITGAAINQVAREKTQAHLRGEFNEGPVRLEIRHANGQPILLEVYEYPITKDGKIVGLQGVAHDITQRNQADQALRENEERLRDFLFSMADWVWEVDKNGVYTFSSDKGSDLLGASRGDIIGKTPFDFMPADEAKRVGALFSKIAANKLPIKDLEHLPVDQRRADPGRKRKPQGLPRRR